MTRYCFPSSSTSLSAPGAVLACVLMACAVTGCASVPPAGALSPPSEAYPGEGQAESGSGGQAADDQGAPLPGPDRAEAAVAPDDAEAAATADRATGTPAAPVVDRPATGTGLILAAPAASPAAAPDRPEDDRPQDTGGSAGTSAGASSVPSDQERHGAGAALVFRLSASPAALRVGDPVTVEIRASSTARVVDAPLHLVYDAAQLRYLGGEEGDFLKKDGSGTVFLINGRSQPGVVTIGVGRLDRSHGLSGAGTHCRVRFEVIAAGRSRVAVGQAMAWADDGSMLPIGTDAIDISVP